MRVLMMTQMLDYNHEILGFTHAWVEALAARVERVIVVPVEEGKYNLPANVTVASMGKEDGRGRIGRAAGFYSALLRYLPQVDVLFAHMSPRYVLAAAPLAALYRKPITLWFTHRQISPELRLAVPLARHIATAHPSSFPIPDPKVRALGHGIKLANYQPGEALPPDPPLIVSLARLSPIKRHETLIRAASLLRDRHGDPPARFVIAGGRPSDAPSNYEDSLRAEIERLRLEDRVSLWGAVPADGVAAVFREASAALNASPPGLFDKAALESMLCAVPTIVANPAFDDLLGDHVDLLRLPSGDDAPGLAERLAALLKLSAEERRAIGEEVRARVAAGHSLANLMDRLVALMAE
jgi:glycosyltransferase involved in cell wall biosynthesis